MQYGTRFFSVLGSDAWMKDKSSTTGKSQAVLDRGRLGRRTGVSISEIAKQTNVSSATVSRALNEIPTVNPTLARRVWKAASELGYFPNMHARALVSGRSNIIGVVINNMEDPLSLEWAIYFETAALESSFDTLFVLRSRHPDWLDTVIRRLVQHRVDAVALAGLGIAEQLTQKLQKLNIPFVISTGGTQHENTIRIDYRAGMRQAVEHLAARRHLILALICGPSSLGTLKIAFEESVRSLQLNLGEQYVVDEDETCVGGKRAVARLASLRVRPTAIICCNDLVAMGALSEAASHGWLVPSEVSIIGFGNNALAEFMVPRLTTVEIPQAQLAKLTFQTLKDALEGKPKNTCQVATSLVVRQTTALLSADRYSPADEGGLPPHVSNRERKAPSA
jgi:LacI family transcriptional regulator